MAFIRTIPPAEAEGRLAEIYKEIVDTRGGEALAAMVTARRALK